MVSHWRLRDCKCPQVSWTLLGILADLNNSVDWMVSTRPLLSNSSSSKALVTEPRAPITTGITVTFMFHGFFSSLARSRYLCFFSLSSNFILLSAGTTKSTIQQVLLTITRSGRLAEIRLYFKIPGKLCKYYLFAWLKFNFLHNSKWIILPT